MNRKLKTDQLKRMSSEQFSQSSKHPIVFMLDNVRSAHNVGSFFRTCDALGLQGLWLTGITPIPPHKEIRKTALGATQTVDWSQFSSPVDAIAEARKRKFYVVVAEQAEHTTELQDWKWPNSDQPVLVVFGNEVEGVTQQIVDQADEVVEIPQFGTKHSFNVAVTGGIVGWEMVVKYYTHQS